MKERGFEVQAASSPGEWLKKFTEREQIATHAMRMHRQITPLKDCAALLRLWRLLRKIRPEIVHSHTPKGGLLGMAAAWLARVPVRIYHIRGLPMMTATGLKRTILQHTERLACRLAHQVLCVSRSVADEAVERGLCPASKIRVLGAGGNGVDAENKFHPVHVEGNTRRRTRASYGIPDNALVVGFVGRIVRDKGCVELAQAWQTLRESFPSSHLLMVGPIESQDTIPREVESRLRSDRRVHMAGCVTNMRKLYGAMDVLVLPTYREGFPNVVVEAAAMELPVVATRIPGCVDAVVDGITGVLVPPRDAGSLAQAVRDYLVDPELRRRHGLAGRQRVLAEFRRERIWRELHELYVHLLRRKHRPTPTLHDEATILTMPTRPRQRRAA